ncbi:hypothetical protein M9434_001937 [Picochlorum sp. BPE23]|nr:hypothetical protein M9434_001937 [Picochlorum sp. BPE23]
MDINIIKYLESLQIQSSKDRSRIYDIIRSKKIECVVKSFTTLETYPSRAHVLGGERPVEFNKVFASVWYDANSVLFGTKCNRLLMLDMKQKCISEIRKPDRESRSEDVYPPNRFSSAEKTGIHALSLNPSRTLIATGGTDTRDLIVLDGESFKPRVSLLGHTDWVFGCAWISDQHLASASKDCRVALWNVKSEHQDLSTSQTDPLMNHKVLKYYEDENQHSAIEEENNMNEGVLMTERYPSRIREVKYVPANGFVAALCGDLSVKLLDPCDNLRKVRTCRLPGRSKDPVCLSIQGYTIAVGSLNEVTLLDPRVRGMHHAFTSIASPDRNYGVRSVEFQDHALSFGTGSESLVIFDTRMLRHAQGTITTDSPSCYGVLRSGSNTWSNDSGNHTLHHGQASKSAIYTHKWHPQAPCIFIGGGPLSNMDDGHLCAFWK